MAEFGPAGAFLVGFIIVLGGLVGAYGVVELARRKAFQRFGR